MENIYIYPNESGVRKVPEERLQYATGCVRYRVLLSLLIYLLDKSAGDCIKYCRSPHRYSCRFSKHVINTDEPDTYFTFKEIKLIKNTIIVNNGAVDSNYTCTLPWSVTTGRCISFFYQNMFHKKNFDLIKSNINSNNMTVTFKKILHRELEFGDIYFFAENVKENFEYLKSTERGSALLESIIFKSSLHHPSRNNLSNRYVYVITGLVLDSNYVKNLSKIMGINLSDYFDIVFPWFIHMDSKINGPSSSNVFTEDMF